MKLLIVVLTMFAQNAFSGNGTEHGNGGAAVMVNGKLCLIDLVRANVCENPLFDDSYSPTPMLYYAIRGFYPEIEASVAQLLGSKIVEVTAQHEPFGLAIQGSLRRYRTQMVNGELKDPYLEKTPVDFENRKLYRVAVRKEPFIYLSGIYYPMLETKQKAALLFHEIVSGVLQENGNTEITQQLLSLLFSQGWNDNLMNQILMQNEKGAWLQSIQAEAKKDIPLISNYSGFYLLKAFQVRFGKDGYLVTHFNKNAQTKIKAEYTIRAESIQDDVAALCKILNHIAPQNPQAIDQFKIIAQIKTGYDYATGKETFEGVGKAYGKLEGMADPKCEAKIMERLAVFLKKPD